MTPMTAEDILEENYKQLVHEEADPSWRHGCYMTQVYERADGTFWQAVYQLSTDGEYNGLREDTATITQVWPKQVMTTVYVTKPE